MEILETEVIWEETTMEIPEVEATAAQFQSFLCQIPEKAAQSTLETTQEGTMEIVILRAA